MNEFVGEKFGMLTIIGDAISKAGKDGEKRKTVMCRCDCGVVKPVLLQNLKNGTTRSCGNHHGEHHGMTNTRLYKTWRNMRDRCNNVNAANYKNYGARGISVCDEWNGSFTAFTNWAISSGYKDNLTIDRIDHDGNYCPLNCKWATMKEQENNKRSNKNISLFGETKTEAEWCQLMSLTRGTISRRMKKGSTEFQAIANPSIRASKNNIRLFAEIENKDNRTITKNDIIHALSGIQGLKQVIILSNAN